MFTLKPYKMYFHHAFHHLYKHGVISFHAICPNVCVCIRRILYTNKTRGWFPLSFIYDSSTKLTQTGPIFVLKLELARYSGFG